MFMPSIGLPVSIFPDDAWYTFAPYGGLHVLTVCACALLIAALVSVGRRLSAHEAAMRWTLGIFGLVYWLSYNIWWNRNGFDPAIGLPLHICGLSGAVAPLALLTLNRWLRATLYFWAFALASQAFIQPALAAGPALPMFWWFWAQHTIVLGYAVFDLIVLSFGRVGLICGALMSSAQFTFASWCRWISTSARTTAFSAICRRTKSRPSWPRSGLGRRALSSWSRSPPWPF